MQSQTFYPLREVPTGGGDFGFVDVLLTSIEVCNLKTELKPLLKVPYGVVDHLDQFLGPQIYTWVEFISILGILFSGEETAMIRRTAMAAWKKKPTRPRGSASGNFPLRAFIGIIMTLLTEGRLGI
jgi:hypothetical protein